MSSMPVYFKEKGFKEPQEKIYYLVAGNGIFLVKKNIFFTTATEVRGLPWCKEENERLKIHLPKKIPYPLMFRIFQFFRKVFQKIEDGEAEVQLFWDERKKEYFYKIPETYAVTGGLYCHYQMLPTPDGCLRVGDVHSHASISASHSSIDHETEKDNDGLHITVGNIQSSFPTISCSIVVSGVRHLVDDSKIISPPPIKIQTPPVTIKDLSKIHPVDPKKVYPPGSIEARILKEWGQGVAIIEEDNWSIKNEQKKKL